MVSLEEEKQIQSSVFKFSPDNIRLHYVGKLMEGPATLQRPTGGQIEIESLFHGLGMKGVGMTSVNGYIVQNRILSPGKNGMGIDGSLKCLTPVPSMAVLGPAQEEKKSQGIIAGMLAFILGRKTAEEKKE